VMTPDKSGGKVWIDNNRLIPTAKRRVKAATE